MLDEYLQQTQRLLGFDLRQQSFSLDDLIVLVNMARRQVAAQGQCCRWLTPVGGSVQEIQVLSGGSDYIAPMIHITPPDSPSGALPFPRGDQAVATAILISDEIASVSVDYGGDGYFSPQVTAIDSAGSGATFKPIISPNVNRTNVGQEVYRFMDIALGSNPGAKSILAVIGVTLVWGQLQYTPQPMGFNKFMREYHTYTTGFLGPPAIYAQFGQGAEGTLHFYPLPDQEYGMQWDCIIIPDDLQDDGSYEAIPDPWRDAVPIYTAYLAMLGESFRRPSITPLVERYYNPKDGGLFGDMMRRARAHSQPSLARTIRL